MDKELVEAVTIIETPLLTVVGLVGYVETPQGLRALPTVWAQHLSDDVRRRFYKNWYRSKKKAFKKHETNYESYDIEAHLKRMKDYCHVIRVIAHTQMDKFNFRQKKAHMMEIQINGGTVEQRVEHGRKFFEKSLSADMMFSPNEMIDVIGVTKGKGVKGVVSRWGVTRLPRKTHRGLRKASRYVVSPSPLIFFTKPRTLHPSGSMVLHRRRYFGDTTVACEFCSCVLSL